MPLVDAAAASGTSIAQAFPRPLAFNLFGQGVAYFQSAQLLITSGQPVEALPSMYGLVTIAARFEQMTSESPGLGLAIRLALDALAGGIPGKQCRSHTGSHRRAAEIAAQAGFPVPEGAPLAENTAIWQSLSVEMLLAQRAISSSYLMAGLHVKPGPSDNSADFHTRVESGPLSPTSSSPPA